MTNLSDNMDSILRKAHGAACLNVISGFQSLFRIF